MLRSILTERTSQNLIKPTMSILNKSTATTIDNSEISHFNALSSTWWDETARMKPLHAMNQLRVPFVRDGLINSGKIRKELVDTPEPLKDTLILDVGCGGGLLAEALARLGGVITGIDAGNDLIEVARAHAAKDPNLSNLTYVHTSIEQYVMENFEKYDAVVTSEVLEHINEKELFLEACVKCLKPGGSIFITTISKTLLSYGAIIASEYIFNLIPRGTHEWNKCIQPHQTQRILEDYKCYTKVVHGMFYNIFTNNWSWTGDTSVNYALHAIKS